MPQSVQSLKHPTPHLSKNQRREGDITHLAALGVRSCCTNTHTSGACGGNALPSYPELPTYAAKFLTNQNKLVWTLTNQSTLVGEK